MTFLFISHDLNVVGAVCDRIAVMQAGEIVEEGPADQILSCPQHPYTQRLLSQPSGSGFRGARCVIWTPVTRPRNPTFMSLVLKSLEDGILTLTIHRPEALNALNRNVIDALSAALEAAQDNENVRVIVLTGAGEKAFVAGADIKEFADFRPSPRRGFGPPRPARLV